MCPLIKSAVCAEVFRNRVPKIVGTVGIRRFVGLLRVVAIACKVLVEKTGKNCYRQSPSPTKNRHVILGAGDGLPSKYYLPQLQVERSEVPVEADGTTGF